LLITLIKYFSDELILLNNILEMSKHVVLKKDDLVKLIAILVTDREKSSTTYTPLHCLGVLD
jgi:hypothetical protein